jgi:hypothetical protein
VVREREREGGSCRCKGILQKIKERIPRNRKKPDSGERERERDCIFYPIRNNMNLFFWNLATALLLGSKPGKES